VAKSIRTVVTLVAPQPSTGVEGDAGLRRLVQQVRRDSLLRNSVFIMATTVVNSGLGFAFWLVAAHSFSPAVVGLTAAVISAGTIIVLLSSLGVGGTLIQSLPGHRGDRRSWSSVFWAGTVAAVATSLLVGGAAIAFLPLFTTELGVLHHGSYVLVFALGVVAMTAGSVVDYAFIAERAAGNMLGRNAAVAAAKVAAVVLFTVAFGTSAVDLLDAWAAAAIIGVILGAVLVMRRANVRRPHHFRELVRTAASLRSRLAGHQLIGMGGALLPYLLPLVVTARLSSTENGYFYTTWMMAGIFLIIAPAVSQSLFAEGTHSPAELATKARSALGIIGALLIPGVVVMGLTGSTILSAFGHAYEQHGVGLLFIVLLAAFPDAVTNIYVALLRVRGRLRFGAGLNFGMGLGIVGLSALLLPTLGIDAIGWSFLVVQLCGCCVIGVDVLLLRRQPDAR
jgi:O-antigen/teichoic acid export membrane protein